MESKDSKTFLIVEPPSQVRFRGPFTRPILATINLINPTDNKIIFKIKTTAPTFYGVRPNFGVVQPRNFVEVEIARQPFSYNPKEKLTHKFMIQSLTAPSETEDINKYWEATDPSHLVSTKLRCVFEVPTESQETKLSKPLEELLSGPTSSHVPIPISQLPDPALSPAPATAPAPSKAPAPLSVPTPIPISISTPIPPNPEIKQQSEESLTQKQIEALNSELHEVRTENYVLRKENVTLKDEIEQFRTMPVKIETPMKREILNESRPIPVIYILSSVTVAVICILIGKFLL